MKDNVLKMVIFSDIHYLDENHDEQFNRKLTKLALPLFEKLNDEINNNIKPDLCIYLGDFIEDTNDHDQDIKNFKTIYNKFKAIKVPFYAVPGNHDLRSMTSRSEIEKLMGRYSTFSINVKGYHLIFLGLDVKNNLEVADGGILKTQYISELDLEWLKEDLKNNSLPCIIFNHFGIAEDNMVGNWWFENYASSALLANRRELKEIFKNNNNNILGVFSGHQHWTKKIIEDDISYYIVGSLTENINNNNIPDGVYLEVQVYNNSLEVEEKHTYL